MIEDLLEFRRSLRATSCCEVRLTTHIRGIETTEHGKEPCVRHGKVVRKRLLQPLERVRRRPTSECGQSVQRGKILELYGSIFREPLLQVGGELLRSRKVAGQSQRKSRGIFHV